MYLFKILHTRNLTTGRTLDRLAGVPEDKLVEAHGSFHTNHCIKCKKEYGIAWMKEEIFADRLPKCTACKKIVKPDIVFFGEDLPEKFHKSLDGDFKECDLLIIMGTSPEKHPFAALVQYPGPRCVRLLINRDAVGRPKFTTWMDDQNDDCLRQHPLGTGLDENSESCIDLAEQYSKTTFTHPRRGSSV